MRGTNKVLREAEKLAKKLEADLAIVKSFIQSTQKYEAAGQAIRAMIGELSTTRRSARKLRHKISAQTKAKMAKAARRREAEKRQHPQKAKKGKRRFKRSAEARANMSRAQKRRYAEIKRQKEPETEPIQAAE